MKAALLISLASLSAAQKQFSEPVYSCPAGFELQGKTCEKQITQQPSFHCVQGQLDGDQCIVLAPLRQICPDGSVPNGKGCAITHIVEPGRLCPQGHHDIGGECHTYDAEGIVEICERGQLEGGQCKLTETAPLIEETACPVGYTERKGSCYKVEVMECTPPHQGKRMLQAGKGARPVAPAQGKSHAGRPVLPAQQAPRYVPPSAKLAITQKTCEVKPNGFELEGAECASHSYLPTTVECSLGEPWKCFNVNIRQYDEQCPAGTTKTAEGCARQEIVSLQGVCPDGHQEMNGQCLRRIPASPICPPRTQLAGAVCLGKETAQPTVQVSLVCTGKNCFQH